jgi:APA family basic amino acid/polyamine antiporter
MFFRQLFAKKTLATLQAEALGENRLRRILGPVGLTSLGIGAIIGAGIFVMTGRVAAIDAGPAIMVSFVVAGIGCALAALCYAEFASMAPVAGSAYTYAYATLGEIVAWAIGWDLILEYAMSAATVGAHWTKYFNELTDVLFGWRVPDVWSNDPFSYPGAYCNLPAMIVLVLITSVLVIGIRESAASNTALVLLKVGVVLFVIVAGVGYVSRANWFDIPKEERRQVEEDLIPDEAKSYATNVEKLRDKARTDRIRALKVMATAQFRFDRLPDIRAAYEREGQLDEARKKSLKEREEALKTLLPATAEDKKAVAVILENARKGREAKVVEKWGILALVGLNRHLSKIDDATRSNFFPYGLSGVMVGAALVFFAFIGFDSISTHAEEAIRPQRDVPIGIIASLIICTLLYIAVSAIITGMQPYPDVDIEAAVASAFRERAKVDNSRLLHASAGLIAAGGLAGMTSVILITLLSQARIFLAMARDRLLPPSVFAAVHERFRTPHVSTMLTGGVIVVVAGFTPITVLEEMVNIGTLFAFVVVCAAVLILRQRNPEAARPFRTPLIYLVAPLGIVVNLTMMLFLSVDSWLRLVIWMGVGLVIYLAYGMWHSTLGQQMRGLIPVLPGGLPVTPDGKTPTATGPAEGVKRPDTDVTGKS